MVDQDLTADERRALEAFAEWRKLYIDTQVSSMTESELRQYNERLNCAAQYWMALRAMLRKR
jgi:hypothetical protein